MKGYRNALGLPLGTMLLATALVAASPPSAQRTTTKGAGTPASQQPGAGPGQIQIKYVTVSGEVLDMGCYVSRGLRGEAHIECALKCLAARVPMGLITADSVMYTLTQNHDRAMTPQSFPPPDPYAQLKGWPGKRVEITGYEWQRKGTRYLEVRSARLLPSAAPPAKAAQ